ncbi:6,7-dimethyl-8-ribityllumazine synthase [Caballeronia sp. LZ032]|uniref:6,7-dimethyl-8-ribityllumazine synthase n=1 Tax=Caballeronia sp. LZ032 TaxID=3038565 RepID=UPI00286391AE|nr:6,7-dimethyl-8-ribityllumazine synthase [Caballeronia sp. LZ032]MDR5879964.1 6,7-dimethyl-8-ribityllumazine synthase [Caballeronia sp. LZ032]
MTHISSITSRRRRIAFVQACWHRDIVDNCKAAFLSTMLELGYQADDLHCFEVPGVFEIPLCLKRLIASEEFDAVVAAGLIVDGGIYRHEFVSTAVIDSLMQLQLQTGTPVISAVLTPQRFHESDVHHAFFLEHFKVKGREAAHACHQTLDTLQRVEASLTSRGTR